MDVDRARTFLEIVRSGSFLKAADRLHVTQTTVSARIRTLEEELGRQLFVRNRNGAQLTPAGREFERFAQSSSRYGNGPATSLRSHPGEPASSRWAASSACGIRCCSTGWSGCASNSPASRSTRMSGVPDQLLEQLRTGVLDVAVLYAPKLVPGFKVELVEEEQLVLVRTTGRNDEPPGAADYVHVDWGPQFAGLHGVGSGSAGFSEPGPFVGLGPLGLSYILRVGGGGYFRRGAAAPHIAAGELEIVEGAPEFTYPAYAVYPEANEARPDVQHALHGLKQVAK